MSTSYTPEPPITAAELFGGRLKPYGIVEHWVKWIAAEDRQQHRMLTDGENYLHVGIDEEDIVRCLSRFAPNGSPDYFFDCIRYEFGAVMMDDGWQPPYEDAEPAPATEEERLAEQKRLSFAVLRAATKLGMTKEDIIGHVQDTFQEWQAHGGQLPEDDEG